MFFLLSLGLFATPLLVFSFRVAKRQVDALRSPLRRLRGPASQSFFFGNIKYIAERDQTFAWDEWLGTYGKTFRYQDILNVCPFSRSSLLAPKLTTTPVPSIVY